MTDIKGQLSPKRTIELLRELDHFPIKKLGQNFLVDSNIVRKSVDIADVKEGDFVVEVGPGLGTLTGALLERGAKVFAVELDKTLFKYLSERFGKEDNFNIINADAVDTPLAALPEDISDFKIVANLPYAISTPWLDGVLSGRLPKTMSLMLQKEAAMRFAAKCGTGDFSPISICLGEIYKNPTTYRISAGCFYPRPGVDSVLLLLNRKDIPYVFLPRTKELMRKVFSKRRKQIASIAKSADEKDSADLTEWLLLEGSPDGASRPDTIMPQQWKLLDKIVAAQ